MKILVTGANGYIGRHVVSELLNMGHQVIACDLHVLNVDERAEKLEKTFSLHLRIFLMKPAVLMYVSIWHGEMDLYITQKII